MPPFPALKPTPPLPHGSWRLTSARLAGLALLPFLWLGPLPALAGVSLTAHMLLHVAMVAVVPALLRIRPPVPIGAAGLLAAGLLDLAAVWGWHLPAAHLWASLDGGGFLLQQASFLLAGIVVWSAAEGAGRIAGAVLLLATGSHMAMLGVLLVLAPRLLYPGVCGGGPLGLAPMADQQVAGLVMALLAPAIFLGAGLIRLAPLLREDGAG